MEGNLLKRVAKKRTLSFLLAVVLALTSIISGNVVETEARKEEAITVFLAGDSTVADWSTIKSDANYYDPQAGWGQMLSNYFDESKVNVVNGAISGYSSKTFYDGCSSKGDNTRHLDELLKDAKDGDYLLIQFGHNDSYNPYDEDGNVMNPGRPDLVERYVTPEQYKEYLQKYIVDAKAKGVTPILVTPVGRMYTEDGQDHKGGTTFVSSFPDYVEAMKEVAKEQGVACIDLDALSRAYYNELGWEGVKDVFLWCEPGFYPNSSAYGSKGASDTTHFQKFGAIQIARMVAQGMAQAYSELQNVALPTVETPKAVPLNTLNATVKETAMTGATIHWDMQEGADVYRIYRSNVNADGSGSEYKLIGQTMENTYIDRGLTADTAYLYKVTAKNYVGENEGEILAVRTSPSSDVTGGASFLFDFNIVGSKTATGWTGITVNKKGGSGATGYTYTKEQGYGFLSGNKLYGRSESVGANGAYSIPKDAYTDFVLASGENFAVDVANGSYTVQIVVGSTNSNTTKVSAEGGSTYSINAGKSQYDILTVSDVEVSDGQLNLEFSGDGRVNGIIISCLEAPQNFEGKINWDDCSVNLSWQKVDGATSYAVYRKGSDGILKLIGNVNADSLSFKDTSISLLETYTYTVRAKNAAGVESASSDEVVLVIKDDSSSIPEAPVNLAVTEITDNATTLIWSGVDNAIQYEIYYTDRDRSTGVVSDKYVLDDLEGYTYLATTKDTTFIYEKSTHVTRYFKVVAVNAAGKSVSTDCVEASKERTITAQAEYLDRGLIAVKTEEGVYVSWRLRGDEYVNTGFALYRDGEKIKEFTSSENTNYLDVKGTEQSVYSVAAIVNGKEQARSEEVAVMSNNYIDIKMQQPTPIKLPDGSDDYTYSPNDMSVGDVDGDGQYEYFVKWDPSNSQDNSMKGYTGPTILDCYTQGGELLWRINLGINIRSGAHYTQYMVYDFDGDGKAELICKTADGTSDGIGNIIGDATADYRNANGYILSGPEYLTLFDGETGEAIDTIDYYPARGNVSSWGDDYGNRVDRFLAGVAYLNGETPSAIFSRGYYTRAVVCAYNVVDKKLVRQWVCDSNDNENKNLAGQGAHSLSISDVDEDGCQEIVYGSAVIDNDGKLLYSLSEAGKGYGGHGDALHVGDFNLKNAGREVFMVHEEYPSNAGVEMHKAGTGEYVFGYPTTVDVGRGAADDIDPRYEGVESWAIGHIFDQDGNIIANKIPAANFLIWWDGDLGREILDHNYDKTNAKPVGVDITKWNWETETEVTLFESTEVYSNNGTKGTPCLQADLFGDWREEVIWRLADNSGVRIYTTTDTSDYRLYTLMHDIQYREAVAWQLTGYNQPPHPSFYIGFDEALMQVPVPTLSYTGGDDQSPELDKKEFSNVKFDFGDGIVAEGYLAVTNELFTDKVGYGFASVDGVTTGTREDEDAVTGDFVQLDGTDFLVNLENGKNYEVTVTLAGPDSGSGAVNITYEKVTQDQMVPNIDAEDKSDRSGLLNEKIAAGETLTRTFTVALVDGQFNLNVSGAARICSVEINQLQSTKKEKTTVYIMGDSTVEGYADSRAPITGWGQTIDAFFTDDVVFENHAIGGRSTGNYLRQGRLNEVLANVAEGDYVLIQFGHNDASKGNEDRYVSVADYNKLLTEEYIQGVIQRGGIPILVTLVNRNDYNSSTKTYNQSFPDYVNGMKEVATTTDTKLIDLNEMSRVYLNDLASKIGNKGVGDIIYLHVLGGFYPSYPDTVTDDTHFQQYGGKVIGSLVAKGIAQLELEQLSSYYKPEAMPEAVPNVPSNLTMEQAQGASVRFGWDKAEDADYYRVERGSIKAGKTTPTEFSVLGYTVTPVYADYTASPNMKYSYRIIAINEKGESAASEYLNYFYEEEIPKVQFDFNITGSGSTADGWTGITVNKKNGSGASGYQYTTDQGYGFITNNTLYGRYEEVGNNTNDQIPSEVYKDFVLASGEMFAVDLENGSYTVKIIVGSTNANTTKVSIENGEEHSINPGKTQYGVLTISNIVIEDGQMNLDFRGDGRVNGIQIYEETVVEEPSTEETTEASTETPTEETTEASTETPTEETTEASTETTTEESAGVPDTEEVSSMGSTENSDVPETGDHSILFLCVLICMSSFIVMITLKRIKTTR